MLTKIKLFFKIRKFYKIYGDENFITSISDVTADNLHDVLFDINEALQANAYCFYEEAYEMDAWFKKLQDQINDYCDRKQRHNKKGIITVLLVAVALIGGYTIGRQQAIHSAELYDITEEGYDISFGDEVHNYTFEEVQ